MRQMKKPSFTNTSLVLRSNFSWCYPNDKLLANFNIGNPLRGKSTYLHIVFSDTCWGSVCQTGRLVFFFCARIFSMSMLVWFLSFFIFHGRSRVWPLFLRPSFENSLFFRTYWIISNCSPCLTHAWWLMVHGACLKAHGRGPQPWALCH